jgi:hypothetical protein
MLDGCFHKFCFSCAAQWSQITPSCPLCKRAFDYIIYNIKDTVAWEKIKISDLGTVSEKRRSYSESAVGSFLRKSIYYNNLQPVISELNFTQRPSPFPGTHSSLAPTQDVWDTKLHIWLNRELPVVLNHNLFAKQSERELNEIALFQRVVQAHLHHNGNLQDSQSARRELEKVIGEEHIDRFLEDTMLFLKSPFRSLAAFDRAVSYTYDGEPVVLSDAEEEAPNEDSNEAAHEGLLDAASPSPPSHPATKKRKTVEVCTAEDKQDSTKPIEIADSDDEIEVL